MEIDPRYCDAIVRRYLAFVGPDHAPDHLLERFGSTRHLELQAHSTPETVP
jgi:hypothetical protein